MDFCKNLTANIYLPALSIGRHLPEFCKQHRADWHWRFSLSKLQKQEKIQSNMSRRYQWASFFFPLGYNN